MEAAADRLALQSLSQNEVSAYGELLLRFAQDSIAAKKSPTLGLISFASGKHLKQRVKLLLRDMAHPKKSETQQRKYNPRSNSGRLDIDRSFLLASDFNSSLVLA
jgi:beta-lactamase regulating signal transducer with metallopeptidase domain